MSGKPGPNRSRKEPSNTARDKNPPDPRIKIFIDWFYQEYSESLGRKYVVQGAKDGKLVKDLLKSLDRSEVPDSLAELQRAARNMLTDPWGKERADIGLLSSKINSWRTGTGGGSTQADAETDADGLAGWRDPTPAEIEELENMQ